jgi:hypothetical protein
MHPPDPNTRRASFTRNEASPEVANHKKQKQRYSVSIETQACLSILLPIVISVLILVIAGGSR